MTVAIGQDMARSKNGVVHVARLVRGPSVYALCGTSVMYPRTTGLHGLRCAICDGLAKRGEA
jgi:hypothetical protein